jgi:excisionase family DNA binding protein
LRECADEIGVSVDLVRRWVKVGELPAKWCGNHYLVLDTALQRFIDSFDGGRIRRHSCRWHLGELRQCRRSMTNAPDLVH